MGGSRSLRWTHDRPSNSSGSRASGSGDMAPLQAALSPLSGPTDNCFKKSTGKARTKLDPNARRLWSSSELPLPQLRQLCHQASLLQRHLQQALARLAPAPDHEHRVRFCDSRTLLSADISDHTKPLAGRPKRKSMATVPEAAAPARLHTHGAHTVKGEAVLGDAIGEMASSSQDWSVTCPDDSRASPPSILSSASPRASESQRPLDANPSTARCQAPERGGSTGQHKLQMLPVWEQEDGRLQQYAWDGRELHTVDSLDHQTDAESLAGELATWLRGRGRRLWRVARTALMPQDVDPAYWPYVRWKCLQRTISAVLQVYATQSLLQAVGVGAKHSLPAAAGLSWVLKDGLGRIGRLSYAAAYGHTFDCHLKRVRFGTSALYTFSLGLETLTPLAPQHFLPLATLANVGKSIGLAAYLATTPAVHKTFALADNLADISAKGQVAALSSKSDARLRDLFRILHAMAQTVLADNVGLAIAMALGAACRGHARVRAALPLALFPPLALLDMFAIQEELRAVPLRSLNKERLEMVTQWWLESRRIPSAAQVSRRERLFLPDAAGEGRLALRMGPLALQAASASELLGLLQAHRERPYVLGIRSSPGPFWRRHLWPSQPHLLLSLREGAQTDDIVQGVLQAGHLRRMVGQATRSSRRRSPSNQPFFPWPRDVSTNPVDEVAALGEGRAWEEILLQESKRQADADLEPFLEALRASEWHLRRILLDPRERRCFSVGRPPGAPPLV